VFGDIELIRKRHTVPGGDWEDLVLVVAVEGRLFDFGIFSPATKVEHSFPTLVSDSELAAYLQLVACSLGSLWSRYIA
jgi:hypothetical protein